MHWTDPNLSGSWPGWLRNPPPERPDEYRPAGRRQGARYAIDGPHFALPPSLRRTAPARQGGVPAQSRKAGDTVTGNISRW